MVTFFNVLARGAMLAACMMPAQVSASVVIGATRVIYEADQNEVTVKLTNVGRQPSLVQAWIDDGRSQAALEDLRVPFGITPPLFRIEPGEGQSLRLFHTGESMPLDRESLYWLNVLQVPPKGTGNVLQFSLRSRIKLLYRPQGLTGRAADAHRALTWRIVQENQGWAVEASNPGRYYINLAKLGLYQGGQATQLKPAHIAPLSSTRFAGVGARPELVELRYSVIDDYGAVREAPAVVNVGRER